jgi:hypothetical protein
MFCCLQGSEKLWQGVFMGRFGLASKNQLTAHKLAGSWQVGALTTPPGPNAFALQVFLPLWGFIVTLHVHVCSITNEPH